LNFYAAVVFSLRSVLWLLLIKSNTSPVARQRATMRWYFILGPFWGCIKEAVGQGVRAAVRVRGWLGMVASSCYYQAHINEAIEDKIQVKNKREVGYTPFLSFLCPWRLDGLRAGLPGLDSRKGQAVSLLHNVQTGSGAHSAPYPMSTGALSPGT
jgi:hypothetical protein